MKRALIIVPAYNEEGNIEKTIFDIRDYAKEFDYIVLNDCSRDNTYNICKTKGFDVINLPINLGIGGAVQTGYRYALENNYDYVVQFDGDGQHSAKYLSKMLNEFENSDVDVVIGSRFLEKKGFQSTGVRRIGISVISFLIKILTGRTITDPTSGMRMVNAKLIKRFADDYPSDYPEPESVVSVLKDGFKVKEIPVIMNERECGSSSINSFWKSSYYMVKVCLAICLVRFS